MILYLYYQEKIFFKSKNYTRGKNCYTENATDCVNYPKFYTIVYIFV